MKQYILLLLLSFFTIGIGAAAEPWAEGSSKAEDIRIKLVTFGVGEELSTWWGHNGVIVEDTALQRSRIYNFGIFSLSNKMLRHFVMGRLIFSGGSASVSGYLSIYLRQKRDIRITTLNLSPQQNLNIAKKLAFLVRPENKYYLYHHYYDNCATRIRDIINDEIGGQLYQAAAEKAPYTLRQETVRYTGRSYWMNLLLMYLMNNSIDQKATVWETMFLPDELEKEILKLKIKDEKGHIAPLSADHTVFYRGKQYSPPEVPPNLLPYSLLYGTLLTLPILLFGFRFKNSRGGQSRIFYGLYSTLLGLFLGIPGMGLTFMAFFTDHEVTFHNENLITINPVTFLLVIIGIMLIINVKSALKWLYRFSVFEITALSVAVIIKILPPFNQDNWLIILFILPIFGGLFYTAKIMFNNTQSIIERS